MAVALSILGVALIQCSMQQQHHHTFNPSHFDSSPPSTNLSLSTFVPPVVQDDGVSVQYSCPDMCTCITREEGHLVEAVCTGLRDLARLGPDLVTLEVEDCEEDGGRQDWGGLASLQSLTVINCTHLENLEKLEHLNKLRISQSSVAAKLQCSLFLHLLHLNLSDTGLQSLEMFSHCQEEGSFPLHYLDLSKNLFSQVSLQELELFPDLEYLNLAYNPHLASISPPSQPFLQLASLYLQYNPKLDVLCNQVITQLPSLTTVDLQNTSLSCSCLLSYTVQQNTSHPFTSQPCRLPSGELVPISSENILADLSCSPPTIHSISASTWLAPGVAVTLDCEFSGVPPPTVLWLTPRLELLRWRLDSVEECKGRDKLILSTNIDDYSSWPGHLTILSNGSLYIDKFGWRDRGDYTCYVDNRFGNASNSVSLDLEFDYRNVLYYWSILFGFITAFAFLALTLTGKLLHHILWNYGCSCFCCPQREPPPRIKRLTTMVDSIETYRIQQLEKLRENYQSNSQRIRDNYTMQVERMREHYSNTRGASQVATESYQSVKDQYFDQLNKMRDYSNLQLVKSHENYIFQRQRLRKFSAQNYLKIRETGKYTQKTLNRVLENMPAVADLTSCRHGQVPPNWEDDHSERLELHEIDGGRDLETLEDDGGSVYFTPSGTPHRDGDPRQPALYSPVSKTGGGAMQERRNTHRRMVSNLSNFFPFWWGMGQSDGPVTTVAVVEPVQEQWNTDTDILEVVVVDKEEELAPLAEAENLSLMEDDVFTDAPESPEILENLGVKDAKDEKAAQMEPVIEEELYRRNGFKDPERQGGGHQLKDGKLMNISESKLGDQTNCDHGAIYYNS